MPEPITEVWVWVTSHPNGRVAGASLNGPGSSIHDMLARGATRETITASEGLFAAWMQDKTLHRYEWNGYTLQRLPLATPEMVRVIGAAARVAAWEANADDDSAIRALSESNLSLGTLLHEVLMLSMAIDAARAAGGAHA